MKQPTVEEGRGVAGSVWIVQIGCVGVREGDKMDAGPNSDYPERYERVGGALAALYGALLGMRRFDPGYIKLRDGRGETPDFGFEGDSGAGDEPPRWPDPDYPQQVHLDIEVGDLDVGEQVVGEYGGTRAADFGDHRVYIDQAGHPFCLYLDESLSAGRTGPLPGRLARIVFDCFSPRALAYFYERLLGMTDRLVDRTERVVIAKPEGRQRFPMLAFQHAEVTAPRWPDPKYPAQLHLDLLFEDRAIARDLAERLGAVLLREKERGCATYADPAAHPFDLCGRGG
jgi:hypothetical protein